MAQAIRSRNYVCRPVPLVELADSLKPARPDLKVLYGSGYTHDLVTQQGILETGSELLQKPFSINALLTRVRLILDGAGKPHARFASASQ